MGHVLRVWWLVWWLSQGEIQKVLQSQAEGHNFSAATLVRRQGSAVQGRAWLCLCEVKGVDVAGMWKAHQ